MVDAGLDLQVCLEKIRLCKISERINNNNSTDSGVLMLEERKVCKGLWESDIMGLYVGVDDLQPCQGQVKTNSKQKS